MTRLVFVRHGRAEGAENRCIGHTDLPLSTQGVDALRELVAGESHASTSAGGTRLFSSDLRRAVETADVIAGAIGCPVTRDARLREMHFGLWDGVPWTTIERDDAERLRTWMENWIAAAPPGGESAADLSHRAVRWTTETLATAAPDERIIVVSHAGWIRAALTHLLARDIAGMFEIPVEHARATTVDFSPSGCVIIAANARSLGDPSPA